MKLKDLVRSCQKCPLYNNMQTSPVPPEWSGMPDLMIISSKAIDADNDFNQENITGLDRIRFLDLLNKAEFNNYYITSVVKCSSAKARYSSKEINTCIDWIYEENSRLKPKRVILCGKNVDIKKFTKIKIDYQIPAISKIVESKKTEQEFIDLLLKIRKDIRGY